MTSKKINITEDVYNKLYKIKGESFSELFLRLLKFQEFNIEKTFGSWNLSKREEKEIWGDIDFHIENGAQQDSTYDFTVELYFKNWNETSLENNAN